jgi:ABC-type nitrate/sulfonate/bicarbonate transport system permease component
MKNFSVNEFSPTIPWLCLLLIWAMLTETRIVDPIFLSSPSTTFAALMGGIFSGELIVAVFATLARAISGFLIATLIGVPLGLLIGGLPNVNQFLGSFIDGLRSMPATALFPAFILLFGIGDAAKIAVVTFVCMWTMTIYTAYGVQDSGETRRFLLRLHKVSKLQFLLDGLFFPALPSILGGMRTSLSLTLVITIATEMIVGTTVGLGQTIFNAQILYQIPMMYAAIILSALAGMVLNFLFIAFSSKLVHWTIMK